MSELLAEICARKREYVTACKTQNPLFKLESCLADAPPVRPFAGALRAKTALGKPALIAEIKKASPSRGVIRPDFDPKIHAADYESAGAACLSILTDTPYFQGEDRHLVEGRAACSLPVLRKDFMIDPYQITEARTLGADCILIIMAAIDDALAKTLETTAHALGMDALIEVHTEAELERAQHHLSCRLVGINNRNLSTLAIDLNTSARLRPMLPADALVVCESGIKTHDDIQAMQRANIHCFLVGESLMSNPDLPSATRRLLEKSTQ